MNFNNFSLCQQLGFLLRGRHLSICVAESCTGGGLAEQMTAVAESSQWFDCGFITYSNIAKIKMLNVKLDTLEKFGSVSKETVVEMAKGALEQSNADISISITGIAGPGGGTSEKPVGLVWIGLAYRHNLAQIQSKQVFLTGGRNQVRHDTISCALQWVLKDLQGSPTIHNL